jgi:L,D-transpeptidase ErfK/SrfK
MALVGAALGCAPWEPVAPAAPPAPPPHPLENPPVSPNLTGRLGFRELVAEDTLIDIAPEEGVGYTELLAANQGVDPWLPPAGRRLVIPGVHLVPTAPPTGIVVNLGDLRLYYFEQPGVAPRSYPIGIAKDGYQTPIGVTKVTGKRENPPWVPGPSAHRDDPKLARVVPPGPANPLGAHALYLGWPSYLIHGTNDPRGVGRHSSRGCIRLYPNDIAELYALVKTGTPVRVVNQPVKVDWIGTDLYLEVNPDPAESVILDTTGKFEPTSPPDLRQRVLEVAGGQADRVDWDRVERAGRARAGIPVVVSRPIQTAGD